MLAAFGMYNRKYEIFSLKKEILAVNIDKSLYVLLLADKQQDI